MEISKEELQQRIDDARKRQEQLREELAELDKERDDFLRDNPGWSFDASLSPREVDDSPVRCPVCGSTQIAAAKKGFGVGKAAAGGLLLGPVGLLGGFIGSRKIKITCLKCGHEWRP